MGWLILIIGIPAVLFILGLIFLKKEDYPILFLLFIFVIPISLVSSRCWNDYQSKEFNKKYIYVTSIKLSDIKNIDWQIDYLENVKWINREIQYAKMHHDSFWYGIFTDKSLLDHKEIEVNLE